MGKNIISVNDHTFSEEVLRSDKPVLVDFTAAWCGPCRRLKPVVERIADEHAGHFKVATVDVDDSPGVTQRYGVRSMPTVMVFRGGEVAAQHVGLTSREHLLRMLGAT